MIRADLLVTNIGELATLTRGPVPRTAGALRDLSIVRDAALAVRDGVFVYVGRSRNAARTIRLSKGGRTVDANDGTVLPGLVDSHSHAIFAGERAFELPWKAEGASYPEIARRGGGILATVRATRSASDADLSAVTAARFRRMSMGGSTTIEVKSGYALDHAGEIRLLEIVGRLARVSGARLVPTYLGAHAVPPRFARRSDRYVDEIVKRTLPEIARRRLAHFCDVFCEPGYFSLRQAERILRAAIALGLGAKIHADEFVASGGPRLAARLGARSADHLLAAPRGDLRALARAGVIGVLLPATPFTTPGSRASPGRELVRAGVPVALGSDCSPNSWIESMSLVLSHAVYSARLTPAEAISAATVNAAAALDLADQAGTITVGRPADFVLYDLASTDEIPYRIGSVPGRVYRQGIRISSPRMDPHI